MVSFSTSQGIRQDWDSIGYKNLATRFFCPAIFVGLMVVFANWFGRVKVGYVIFFVTPFLSLTGGLGTLTGFVSAEPSLILTGVPFYTASLAAYYINRRGAAPNVWTISNPLFLISGPILALNQKYRQVQFRRRFFFYFPFLIIGVFFTVIVSSPLPKLFFIFDRIDILSTVLFSLIFEIFVCFNFCGISMMVFAVAVFFGYKISMNFNQPFSARNLIEFWRGWHTSFSQLLKSAFYNPTRKFFGAPIAILLVFVASGIWHGASLNFTFDHKQRKTIQSYRILI